MRVSLEFVTIWRKLLETRNCELGIGAGAVFGGKNARFWEWLQIEMAMLVPEAVKGTKGVKKDPMAKAMGESTKGNSSNGVFGFGDGQGSPLRNAGLGDSGIVVVQASGGQGVLIGDDILKGRRIWAVLVLEKWIDRVIWLLFLLVGKIMWV